MSFIRRSVTTFTAAALAVCAGLSVAQAADQRFVTIGTGAVTGVYYPAGGAICRLVNQQRATYNIRCSVESTGASVFNLNAIRSGELDLGVAQSDAQYQALMGEGPFKERGPDTTLRAVFSLHAEPLTLVVRDDAGIKSLQDIKGKRVNIGNPGSGTRATMERLLDASGIKTSDLGLAAELKPDEQSQALCDNKIDAFFFLVGHPAGNISETITTCRSKLVSVTGPGVDALIRNNPYFVQATIPGGMYRTNPDPITSFGVKATFVTSSKTDPDVVYAITKSVFDNLEDFKKLHPAFGTLTAPDMIKNGNAAPLHEGAIRYFKEKGLM